MNIILIVILSLILSFSINAQLPDGSIAPDFTAVDIYGNSYNLYDLLSDGKTVVLDFSTTWCGGCWMYYQSGALEEYLATYGPDSLNESMVLFIESDVTTTMADLLGQNSPSQVNWVANNTLPIIDDASIASKFQITGYPTIMSVCLDRTTTLLPNPPSAGIYNITSQCQPVQTSPEISFRADKTQGCESVSATFIDNSWPRGDVYLWDFGDGSTASGRTVLHEFNQLGQYTISLSSSNIYGTSTSAKVDYINVETGFNQISELVGPIDSSIGTGRYFEHGSQGLIFDALDDMFISSVKVFSDRESMRTIVIHDQMGNLLHEKNIIIGAGEHRINLDFIIPQGTNYRIGLYGDGYLWRNDGGVTYPYQIDSLVNIKESTASIPTQYYYYFYEWEVRHTGCSLPNPLFIQDNKFVNSVTNTPVIDILHTDEITIFPNPSTDFLYVELDNISTKDISIHNAIGRLVQVNIDKKPHQISIDVSSLPKGTYFVRITNKTHKFVKK